MGSGPKMSEFAHAGLEIWLVWRPEAPTVAAAALRRRGGYLWPLAVTPVTNSSGSVGFGPSTVRMARVPPQTVPLEPLHDQNRPISLCCTPHQKGARGASNGPRNGPRGRGFRRFRAIWVRNPSARPKSSEIRAVNPDLSSRQNSSGCLPY